MIFCGNKSIMLMENLQWIILPSRWGFEVWGWRGGRVGGLEGEGWGEDAMPEIASYFGYQEQRRYMCVTRFQGVIVLTVYAA